MGATYGKANVALCSSSFKKALRVHSQQGNQDILQQLIDEGVDVNMGVDEDNHRPIHYVAKAGHWNCIKTIVDAGGDINVQNNFGLTGLHCACQKEHIHTIRELIDQGAKLDIKDRFGWTPMHYACKQGCAPAIRVLKEKGADMNSVTKWDWTPVHVASRWGRSACLVELLKDEACIDHIMMEDLSENNAIDLGAIFADKQENGRDVVLVLNDHLKPRIYANDKQTFKEKAKRETIPQPNTPLKGPVGGKDETTIGMMPTDIQEKERNARQLPDGSSAGSIERKDRSSKPPKDSDGPKGSKPNGSKPAENSSECEGTNKPSGSSGKKNDQLDLDSRPAHTTD